MENIDWAVTKIVYGNGLAFNDLDRDSRKNHCVPYGWPFGTNQTQDKR